MFRGTHHTVLLFTGLDDDARPAVELCRIAEQLEQTYPGLVKARVVTPSATPITLRHLAIRRGQRTVSTASPRPSAFVVRPDKYIDYAAALSTSTG